MPTFWFTEGAMFSMRNPPNFADLGGFEDSMFDIYSWVFTQDDMPKLRRFALTKLADQYPLNEKGNKALCESLTNARYHTSVFLTTLIYHILQYLDEAVLVWEAGMMKRWQGWEAAENEDSSL